MEDDGSELLNLFREVSGKYYDFLEKGDPEFSLEMLRFDFQIDSKDFIWGRDEKEFTKAIINEFNGFVSCLRKINLFEKIISSYDKNKHDALRLRDEFTHIPLHYCLNKPYEFAARITYCCIRLCNRSNHIVFDLEDFVEEPNKYSYRQLKCASKRWNSRNGLLGALNSVGNWNDDFKTATDDYRNKTQHQMPPNLDMGLSNFIRKEATRLNDAERQIRAFLGIRPDQQSITYGLGGKPPLKTADMIPVLVQQGKEMRKLFDRYWALVVEQNNAINAKRGSSSGNSER